MSGLLGFAIASALMAVIGSTLRGILRPISWALLAIALGLLFSNQLRTAAGQGTTGAVDVAQSPNTPNTPTPTPAPGSPIPSPDRPIAQEGWQDVAEALAPIFSDAIADSEVPFPPSPDDILSSPQPTPAPTPTPALTPTPAPTVIVPATPTPPLSAGSSRAAASRQVESAPEPIQGFW